MKMNQAKSDENQQVQRRKMVKVEGNKYGEKVETR